MKRDARHSDFIVYVDESGDHGLARVEDTYPVFVLAFCVFRKSHYCESVVPAVQQLKFRYFGHDQVVLHERDIRKGSGAFSSLYTSALKAAFMESLSDVVAVAPFTLIAAVIRKVRFHEIHPGLNVYDQALKFGLERLYYYLRSESQLGRTTHVVVERRGKREDDQLELEFRRICDRDNYMKKELPFSLVFADKRANSVGMQFADLIARPIGMHVLRPAQANRAYEAIEPKFYRSSAGAKNGYGLKLFP